MKQRDHSMDVLRGIAIFFVIFGHITHINDIRTYIWGFHMPLFFWLSGYFFYTDRYANTKDFVKSRLTKLIVPYVIFYLITFCYRVVIERHVRGADLSLGSQLFGMLYGTYDLRYMYFNGALWFLPCLVSMEILYWLISKVKNIWIMLSIIVICHAVGICFHEKIGWLPWGITSAMIALVYFALGVWARPFVRKIEGFKSWIFFVAGISLIVVQYIVLPFTGADLGGQKFSYPQLYIPISVLGIGAWLMIAKGIRKNTLLEWMGRNTLVLFAFQEPVYRMVIFIMSKVVNQPTDFIRTDLLCALLCTVLSIIVIAPLVWGYGKYVNPVIKRL